MSVVESPSPSSLVLERKRSPEAGSPERRKRHRCRVLKPPKSLSDSRLRDSFHNKNRVFSVDAGSGQLLCTSCACVIRCNAALSATDRDLFLRDQIFKPTWSAYHWRTFLCGACSVRAVRLFARPAPEHCMNCLAEPCGEPKQHIAQAAAMVAACGNDEQPPHHSYDAAQTRSTADEDDDDDADDAEYPDDNDDDADGGGDDATKEEGSDTATATATTAADFYVPTGPVELVEHPTRWACAQRPTEPRVILLCQYCTALCEKQLESVRYLPD